jgi:hypothetical protein
MLWELANGPSANAVAGFTLSSSSVSGGATVTGTVTLHGYSSADGISVNLTSNSSAVTFSSPVYVKPGARAASFTVTANPTLTATTATLTVSVAGYPKENKTADLHIDPTSITGISLSQTAVFGGSGVTGTVTLSGPAPPTGFKVLLKSSSSDAALPASVQLAAGATSATFAVTTKPVAVTVSATISGSLGSVSKSSKLEVDTPLYSLTIAPKAVNGGNSAKGTITLTAPAPSGGLTVTLATTANDVASPPQSILIPSGATSQAFTVVTYPVTTSKTVTIKAVSGLSTQSATIKVNP